MPETTTTIGVAAPTAETKAKKSRGLINQAHARELNKAEAVAQAATNADRVAALASRDIDDEYVTAMVAEIGNAREKAGEALNNTTAQRAATAAQANAEAALVAGLQEAQKAAKQKYARSNRIALADYFVGQKLNGSKPNLAQTSQTMVDKLATDKLPGFTTAKVKALAALRTAWVDATETQAGAQSAALSARAELKTLLKSVTDRRVTVQLAADAEWPHTEAEYGGVRKEFALAAKRPARV